MKINHSKLGIISTGIFLIPCLSLAIAILELTESDFLDVFYLCSVIIIPLIAVIIGIIGKNREQIKTVFPTIGITLNSIWLGLVILVTFLVFQSECEFDDLSAEMERIGFTESAPLKIGSRKWLEANNCGPAFIVEINNSISVHKQPNDTLNKKEISYEIGDVKYIGVDNGEFGGGVYINEYNETNRPFFKGNIKALLPVDDDLYIVEGLAHSSYGGGSVHVIRNCKIPSAPERITLLPSAPEAVLLEPNNETIIMAGHDDFMVLSLHHRQKLKIRNQDVFWSCLYPSSIQKYKEWYLFGIQSGVIATEANYRGFNRFRYFTLGDK